MSEANTRHPEYSEQDYIDAGGEIDPEHLYRARCRDCGTVLQEVIEGTLTAMKRAHEATCHPTPKEA